MRFLSCFNAVAAPIPERHQLQIRDGTKLQSIVPSLIWSYCCPLKGAAGSLVVIASAYHLCSLHVLCVLKQGQGFETLLLFDALPYVHKYLCFDASFHFLLKTSVWYYSK